MSPIRHMTRREWLIAFWAVVVMAAVVSSGALISAHKANNTAQRSEKGFCIAIKLIEGGAVADAEIANNPNTTPDTKRIRNGTARGSLSFASQLRDIVHCDAPPPKIKDLYLKFKINPRTKENK